MIQVANEDALGGVTLRLLKFVAPCPVRAGS